MTVQQISRIYYTLLFLDDDQDQCIPAVLLTDVDDNVSDMAHKFFCPYLDKCLNDILKHTDLLTEDVFIGK